MKISRAPPVDSTRRRPGGAGKRGGRRGGIGGGGGQSERGTETERGANSLQTLVALHVSSQHRYRAKLEVLRVRLRKTINVPLQRGAWLSRLSGWPWTGM